MGEGKEGGGGGGGRLLPERRKNIALFEVSCSCCNIWSDLTIQKCRRAVGIPGQPGSLELDDKALVCPRRLKEPFHAVKTDVDARLS